MKRVLFLIFLWCATINTFFATPEYFNIKENYVPHWTAEDELLVKDRLQLMISPIELKFDAEVRENIKSYTTYGYKGTERIIGNTVLYFPIFEEVLQQYNLPDQLKYLTIVESKLNPHANSKAGAVGLWQLMPATARELGLNIGSYVDERRDPHKSTAAAAKHLKDMYNSFGDWQLAIAAYNSGAGNVRKAIRLSGSSKYAKLKSYLPRETQKYLSRFVAASYIAENFHFHNIQPRYPESNLSLFTEIKLYSSITFRKIASISGVNIKDIQKLNPAYLKGVVPSSRKGNYLILPNIGMTRFQNYLKYSDVKTNIPNLNTASSGGITLRKVTYTVKSGDTLSHLASIFNCDTSDIRSWNDLRSNRIFSNQELVLYVK